MTRTVTIMRDRRLPCGGCAAGVYATQAVRNGLDMFGHCPSQRDALRAAPRCKHEAGKICMGARDFIVASTFPIDRDAVLREVDA